VQADIFIGSWLLNKVKDDVCKVFSDWDGIGDIFK
jgi:hypothetical protein